MRDIRNGEVDDSLLHANAKVGKWVPHHVDWRWTEKSCECGMCPEPKTGEEGKDEDACYAGKFWVATCAMFHNSVLANDSAGWGALDKGDSFRWTHVKDGPTAIPAGGWVGFHDPEQIADYTLDYDLLAKKHVIDKMENIYYGMKWDFKRLSQNRRRYSPEDFLTN